MFFSLLSIKTLKPFLFFKSLSLLLFFYINILVNRNYTHESIICCSFHLDLWAALYGHVHFVSKIVFWRLSKKDFSDFTALLKRVLKTKFFHSIFVQVMNKSIVDQR